MAQLLDLNTDVLSIIGGYVKKDNLDRMDLIVKRTILDPCLWSDKFLMETPKCYVPQEVRYIYNKLISNQDVSDKELKQKIESDKMNYKILQ